MDQIAERTHFAVSVRDQASGATFDHGIDRFRTASLVKVHLVALMAWRADRAGTRLTREQRRDAEEMLVRSENDPANRVYSSLGGRDGIEEGLEAAFGRSGIHVGDELRWGRSTTTPREVVTLLDEVLDPDQAGTFSLMQDAMSRVVPEQRWGIPVVADDGTRVQTKVGWFETPRGWVVNGSGRVVVDGSPVLISVMTDRNRTLEAGIARVEEVARLAAGIVRERRVPRLGG
ncbi:MAG: serine hydrolase [Aeromicrobium sp.]